MGAGPVGLEKVEGLLAAEADVHVVALRALPEIEQLAREGSLRLDLREYRSDDLEGAFLVFAATADTELNVRVFQEAEARTMLVNVVDVPPLCNFIMPAIARVGPISIAVSTRGASPALAKRLRSEIAERYGEPYAQLAEMLNEIRGWARDTLPTYQDRKRFFEDIVHARARSDRAPARGRPPGRARPHRGARARRRERRCAGLRARVRGASSRASPSARSARPSACSARPTRRSSAPMAPALRRANATAYLDARAGRSPLLLVGEAMGYAGGRFSGIAFTAERTLLGWGAPFAATSLRPEGWAEQSGTIVHGALATLGIAADTVLWNVVPAHPHRPGRRSRTARPPSASCARAPRCCGELIERLAPRATIAVGRSAERALRELGLPCHASVRHPANGGATAFRSGLARLGSSVAVGALRVARVPDRRAQRQRAQHQHERDAAEDRVRDHHRRLRADRERQQLAVAWPRR